MRLGMEKGVHKDTRQRQQPSPKSLGSFVRPLLAAREEGGGAAGV